ncbi:cyclin-D4-2-like [Durio zibethinus]|uniref:Cyclin-D4-2-like n=1 Tax=Durio zibethinus TaxID=66656 RepID=A0A6P5ZI56_DURZI|nr:cyclin-D4-2-like [Durio zibethinus]
MAENLDCLVENLLCSENTSSCFDGDLDFNAINEFGVSPACHHHFKNQIFNQQDPFFINNRSTSLMGSSGFAIQSDDIIKEMVEREMKHLPRDDYLKRLRSGDLDLSVRRGALEWISKACASYRFGPLTLCLSINYLDRFLSVYELARGKTWTVQLLAVACLSVAAKMEETKVPLSVDLQVGQPKFVFEDKTIQRMELLVLSTLKWEMHVLTPCSFIDYFLSKICNDQYQSSASMSRSLQLILSTIRGIDFLEFRPSEIAAAVAISVSGEIQTLAIDEAISSFIFVEKGRVLKCVELMKDLSLINGSATANANVATPSASSMPQSPIGVLDAACLSYKSDEITVGLCANSSHSSPDIKRRKQDNNIPSQLDFKS